MARGIEELITFVDEMEAELISSVIIAGQGLLGDLKTRIHTNGQQTSGGNIASGYSTKKYYSAIDRFINRGGIPKENISKSGKWVQLPEGYSSFRKYSGRGQKVDLNYTGGLSNSMLLIQTETGFVIGYPQDFVSGSDDHNGIGAAELSVILEDQYGVDIFAPSEAELEVFFQDFFFEFNGE